MTMNKTDRILDVIEHPEEYSDEQLEQLLSDPEMRELYTLLTKTKDAYTPTPSSDVDAEWQKFSAKHNVEGRKRTWFSGYRSAAAIAIGIAASLAAVAAGIVLSTSVGNVGTEGEETVIVSEEMAEMQKTVDDEDTTAVTPQIPEVKLFKEESLTQMLDSIAIFYDVKVQIRKPETGKLRLYFRWDKSKELSEVVEMLNSFEQISIALEDDTMIVE